MLTLMICTFFYANDQYPVYHDMGVYISQEKCWERAEQIMKEEQDKKKTVVAACNPPNAYVPCPRGSK